MKQNFLSALAAIAIIGVNAATARAQQPDTIRVIPDTTQKPDSSKVVRDTTRTAPLVTTTSSGSVEAKKEKPAPAPRADLRSLGTVPGGVRLAADLSARTLTVVAQNGTVRTFNVAIGTPSYPTPTGSFKIRRIVWNPSWVPPDSKWAKKHTAKGPGEKGNPMKVAKIFFKEPDYYIHGTGEVNSLGKAASHGCLRMHPDEIAELAQFLMLNGGQAREESWFSRVLHFRARTHTVTLSQPISITVSP